MWTYGQLLETSFNTGFFNTSGIPPTKTPESSVSSSLTQSLFIYSSTPSRDIRVVLPARTSCTVCQRRSARFSPGDDDEEEDKGAIRQKSGFSDPPSLSRVSSLDNRISLKITKVRCPDFLGFLDPSPLSEFENKFKASIFLFHRPFHPRVHILANSYLSLIK